MDAGWYSSFPKVVMPIECIGAKNGHCIGYNTAPGDGSPVIGPAELELPIT